jgi:hypothetical protein
MSNLVSVETVQSCVLSDSFYSRQWFLRQVEKMDQEQFMRLCREIIHLGHHYDTTIGLTVTDKIDADGWEIEMIDFDKPITIRKIR